jgi:diguanylate cyclase (GGDEF)-like protein
VVVFLNNTREKTYARLEQSRQSIQALRVKHANDEMKITVSIGLAIFPEHGAESAQLLQSADQALYVAKASGRNRVIIAKGTQSIF